MPRLFVIIIKFFIHDNLVKCVQIMFLRIVSKNENIYKIEKKSEYNYAERIIYVIYLYILYINTHYCNIVKYV